MSTEDRHDHWQKVYTSKGENEVSWFQESPAPSLELIERVSANPASDVIDIGGGASRLVDALIERGFSAVTVLDLSEAALATAKARLGARAKRVQWVAGDVTIWEPRQSYDIWHDRAAFHFLTEARDRAAYLSRLRQAVRPGGHAIIATFALDGPERCSGLPVMRYDAASLAEMLGEEFTLIETQRHQHSTPCDSMQQFQFSIFRRV